MPDPSSPYAELGVEPDATQVELRAAYLRMARRFHPDRLVDAPEDERARAAARMARVNAAWELVADPEARRAHDRSRGQQRAASDDRRAWVADADTTFRPLDDDLDVADLDDAPTGAPTFKVGLTVLPALVGVVGFLVTVVGGFTGLAPFVALGVMLMGGGVLSFIGLPIIALFRSRDADRRP